MTLNQQELAEIRARLREIGPGLEDLERRVETLSPIGRREPAASEPEPLLVFVHIPKTAGGTATSMFSEAFTKRAIHHGGNFFRGPARTVAKVSRRAGGWESWQRAGGRLTVGHVPYGLFRANLPPGTRYLTFLREPVDRVLSHYYRHRHATEADEPSDEPESSSVGLKIRTSSLEVAFAEHDFPELNNLQTRFLCGDPEPTGILPASAVEAAKESLRGFAFVGIQERFTESIALLQRILGLGPVPVGVSRHVNPDRPGLDQLNPEQRALIEAHNELDAELYRFGRELFEERWADVADDLTEHLEELGRVSAVARRRDEELGRRGARVARSPPGRRGDDLAPGAQPSGERRRDRRRLPPTRAPAPRGSAQERRFQR